jgi:hypothetical protein
MQVGNWKERSDLKDGLRPFEKWVLPAGQIPGSTN